MKRFIIGSGWKMNNTVKECLALINELENYLGGFNALPLFVLPPFTALESVGRRLIGRYIKFGAQNMHWEVSGAYTGEISAPMLVELGCTYVELNHQERRAHFNENNKTTNNKLHTGLKFGLQPILCLGEEEKVGAEKARDFLDRQLREMLAGVGGKDVGRILFAYEPRWAIGQTEAASPAYIENLHGVIREILADIYGAQVAEQAWIIYGGSVDRHNAVEIAVRPNVDGLFIGRAGLKPDCFADIILSVARALGRL